jgi:hypothetical protein
MDDEKVLIKSLKVEYISTKIDAYDNELCYFKFRDKTIDSKLAVLIKEGFKYPWFKTDKGQTILKIKKKYMKLKETNKEEVVIVDLSFKYYKINDKEGYYVSGLV